MCRLTSRGGVFIFLYHVRFRGTIVGLERPFSNPFSPSPRPRHSERGRPAGWRPQDPHSCIRAHVHVGRRMRRRFAAVKHARSEAADPPQETHDGLSRDRCRGVGRTRLGATARSCKNGLSGWRPSDGEAEFGNHRTACAASVAVPPFDDHRSRGGERVDMP